MQERPCCDRLFAQPEVSDTMFEASQRSANTNTENTDPCSVSFSGGPFHGTLDFGLWRAVVIFVQIKRVITTADSDWLQRLSIEHTQINVKVSCKAPSISGFRVADIYASRFPRFPVFMLS